MNHPSINFGFQFVSDGVSTSVSINLTSGPVLYNLPPSTGIMALSGGFNTLASGVTGLAADSGLTVTTSTLILGVLTVNFTGTVPSAGTVCMINGVLTF